MSNVPAAPEPTSVVDPRPVRRRPDPLSRLDFLGPAEAPDEMGRLGPYRILDVLGVGGMGAVFKAEDPHLGRLVAVKVVLPHLAMFRDARLRFLREARAQAAVEHDNVVPIFQVGEANGAVYLAMPLLKGETLGDRLRRGPQVGVAEVVRVGREVAAGLSAAHARGLIHRDIKPGNVWLDAETGRVKILDFGLARETVQPDEATDPLTDQGTTVGTPEYMSPEQARARPVDHRTDLFSLGVVLYQMATGRHPFAGPDTYARMTALAVDTPDPPTTLNPAVPAALSELIARLLAKAPDDRPSSARVVAEDLRRVEESLPLLGAELPVAVSVGTDPWGTLADAASKPVSHPRRALPRRAVAVWAAVAVAVLLVGGLVAAQVARMAAPRGTLVVESADPVAELIVRKDGAVVVDRTRAREIALPTGEYTVELADAKDGLKLSADRVEVSKDLRTTVRVRQDKPRPAAAKPRDGELVRRAVETLRPAVARLSLQWDDGTGASWGRGDPLPERPFVVTAVVFAPNAAADPAVLWAAAGDLKGLTDVTDSPSVPLTAEALARLADSPAGATLSKLVVTSTDLTGPAVTALSRFPSLARLHTSAATADDDLLVRLGREVHGITELGLHGVGKFGPVSARGMAGVAALKLRTLAMMGCVGLTRESVRPLVAMPTLESFDLWNSQAGGAVVAELATGTQFRYLGLLGNPIGDADLTPLHGMPALQGVNLEGTTVSATGVQKLVDARPGCHVAWDGPGKK